MEPTLYLGKQPFYITFFGVDKKTGETKTEESETGSTSIENLAEAVSHLGYGIRKKNIQNDGVAI